jgi:hypothetical protein
VTTRSVTELLADLRDRADIEEMTIRHTDARLCRYITQSCRALRAELTAAGFSGLLDWSSPTALPTSPPTTGENFLEVSWPATAIEILGFDVNLGSGSSSRWYPLRRISIGERREFYPSAGHPVAFLIRTIPKEDTPADTDLSAGAIQVYPASTLGLQYRIQYLPEFPELTASPGTQVVNGFDGDWLEWVLWDAAVKVAYKDDEDDLSAGNLFVKATSERDRVKARIVTNINRVNRAGPITPFRAGYGRGPVRVRS